MRNKLEETINYFIEEAQRNTDNALENEIKIYNYTRTEAVHTEGSIFRKIVAFIKGERYEIEEHRNNVTDAISLSAKNRNRINDEARIITVNNLFKSALAHFNKAKHDIGLYLNKVINSTELYSELGYKELLDEATADLKTCNRIKLELKNIQDKNDEIQKDYIGIMENIEKIRVHNTTLIKEKNKRGENENIKG